MVVIRWIFRRLWNSQVRRYRVLSRLVTAFAVVKWFSRRRSSVRRVHLGSGETLVMDIARVDRVMDIARGDNTSVAGGENARRGQKASGS